MAEQVGKFLTELPELETPTDGDLMYIVDDETTSKKVTMANLKRVLGGNVTGTVEGASVSFSDGADGIPMEECEVTLVPTQDLHGYSKPWAGGAGKNKFNTTTSSKTESGVTWTVNADGTITVSGTAEGYTSIIAGSASVVGYSGNVIISGLDETTNIVYNVFTLKDANNATIDTISVGTNTNQIIDLSQYANVAKIEVEFKRGSNGAVSGTIKTMIESGSTATTYEPYSNICPISGHTDVTVTVASTSGGSGEDTTVSLGRTVYGGNLDVTTGELEVTWENIASYAGETLTGEWLSSLDEYSTLGTPTTGAQVVYELATPQTFNLTPTQVKTLLGQNYVSHDGGGNIKVVYFRDLDIVINDLIDRVTALENE